MKQASPPSVFRLHLLQSPSLLLPDGKAHLLERKDAALLALIVIDGSAQPAQAAALLWPDRAEAQARSNLRQRLFRLRKAAGGADVVVAYGSLHLASGIEVDVLQLEKALVDDAQAGAGELLGSLDYDDLEDLGGWVTAARQRWRDQRLERLAAHASALEASQQIAAALVVAQRMTADDPLLEHAHRRVMRLHYLRADRAAALAAYQACRDTLRHELGAQPSRETDDLAALIEASGALPQAAPPARAVAALRPPRLVGRDEPWRRLQRVRAEGGLAVVEGEAGVGKTRLMGDFALVHGQAPHFNGRPGDGGLPYALLARMLRGLDTRFASPLAAWVRAELARIAPGFGTPAEGAGSALRLQQAVVQAFTEWQQAGLALVIVDDLHFADAATIEMLPALVAAGPTSGIAWVLGSRNGELPAAASAWLDADNAPVVERIVLGPLDLDGVRDLLVSLALPGLDAERWAPTLTRHTGGNPLFLLETLIALLTRPEGATSISLGGESPRLPAPERVGRLIERRLAQLSPAALKLARVAAIAGVDFSATLAAQVLGAHALDIADTWRELEAAGVIRDSAFAHDLVLEGVVRSIPQPIARLLHRDLAQVLGGKGAPPVRLAAHWAAAEEWHAAGAAYEAAARAAFTASRRIEEAALWQEAVLSYDKAGDADSAFNARAGRITAMALWSSPEQTLREGEQMLACARSPRQRMMALFEYAKPFLFLDRRDEAAQAADEALVLADRHGGFEDRLGAATLSMLALVPGPRADEAIARMRAFAPLVEAEATPSHGRAYYHINMGRALQASNRYAEAAVAHRRAVDAARALGDTTIEAVAANNVAEILYLTGGMFEGRVCAEHCCRLVEDAGEAVGLLPAAVFNMLGKYQLAAGQFGAALASIEASLRRWEGAGESPRRFVIENTLALIWLQLGQTARAQQLLSAGAPTDPSAPHPGQGGRHLFAARLDQALGKSPLPALHRALEAFAASPDPYMQMRAELDLSRHQDPATALATCVRLQRDAETQGLVPVALRARLFAVDALRRGGNVGAAAELARQLTSDWGECKPADLYWPEALWIAHEALRDAGDGGSAKALLRGAAAWIEETARAHVPPEFRDSFLQRNAVNRMVLAACAREPRVESIAGPAATSDGFAPTAARSQSPPAATSRPAPASRAPNAANP